MKFGGFIISTAILILVGVIGSVLYIKIDNKDLFGGMKVGIIVGITGGILGGFMFDLLFKFSLLKKIQEVPYIKHLLVNQFDINFIASVLGVWLFLSVYEYVSKYTDRS